MSETKSKGGRPSEFAGKTYGIVADKAAIKAYKSKSPAVEAAIRAILASKKKTPKVDEVLGSEVEYTAKDGVTEFVKVSTAHLRRAVAEGLISIA